MRAISDHNRNLVLLWQRFGPYHVARLRGAADVLGQLGWNAIGLEVCRRDEYAWKAVDAGDVRRVTALPCDDYTQLTPRAIRKGVGICLDKLNPDAVAINGWSVPEARAAATWCRRYQRRAILMSETFEPSCSPLKEFLKRRRLRVFGTAIVGGAWQARYLSSLGFAGKCIRIGYDAVDNQHFSPARNAMVAVSSTLASAVTGPRKPPRAVPGYWASIGRDSRPSDYFFANTRFLPRKNMDGLLRAYQRYEARVRAMSRAPCRLIISGSGPMESEWKELARSLGVESRIHWTGFLQYDDLPAYYQSAAAFVHVPHREAWGLVLNEACAAGLPLIAGSRVGATCELLRPGENGWLADSHDIDAIAQSLWEAWRLSVDQRQRMSHISQQLVARIGPERFGQALAELLELNR